jgi:hypothetical protein
LKSGSSDDPAGKFGLASLTAAMLDEGAGSRSALEIADEIDFLGADLGTTSSFDASAVRLGVPVARLEPALSVMADVVLRPTFPDAELERVRQERLTGLLQAKDDPATVCASAVRVNAPLRHGRGRHSGDDQELHGCRPEGVSRRRLPAEQRHLDRGWRSDGGQRRASTRKGLRLLARRRYSTASRNGAGSR